MYPSPNCQEKKRTKKIKKQRETERKRDKQKK